MAPSVQDRAFGEALRAMRQASGRSLDTVSHHGWSDDAKLTASQIGQIERGTKRGTYATLRAILNGIGAPPTEWPAIVRLNVLRGQLDENQVGAERALATLAAIESGMAPEEAEFLGSAEGFAAAAATDGSPSSVGQPARSERRTRPATGRSKGGRAA